MIVCCYWPIKNGFCLWTSFVNKANDLASVWRFSWDILCVRARARLCILHLECKLVGDILKRALKHCVKEFGEIPAINWEIAILSTQFSSSITHLMPVDFWKFRNQFNVRIFMCVHVCVSGSVSVCFGLLWFCSYEWIQMRGQAETLIN